MNNAASNQGKNEGNMIVGKDTHEGLDNEGRGGLNQGNLNQGNFDEEYWRKGKV